MSVRLSHSAKSKYLSCAHSYKLHYIERWRSQVMSSALLFGGAMDNALNHMLLNKDVETVLEDTLNIFIREWEQGEDLHKNKVDLPLNPNIKYFRADFDHNLLEKSDWAEIFKYDGNFFDTKKAIEEELAAGKVWLDISEDSRMVINYANWLCLQKKGDLIIRAFHKDILPLIKEVLAVQMQVELDDGEGNVFNGIIDYVARLHDDRVIIMDNKTTSTEYDESAVSGSEQLATYYAILNIFNDDPDHKWKHRIDGAGYSVLSKKIITDVKKTCKECGHSGEGSHKTCDNIVQKDLGGKKGIKDVRCNGEWIKDKTFTVTTQFITGEISEAFADTVLENATTVKSCIEQGLFPKNFSVCENIFGAPCQFIGLCHRGDSNGLVKLEKKT